MGKLTVTEDGYKLKDIHLPFQNKNKAARIYGSDYLSGSGKHRSVSISVHGVTKNERRIITLPDGVTCETTRVQADSGDWFELNLFTEPKKG
jgi:hypothetical protein